jgi:hypothetical protein
LLALRLAIGIVWALNLIFVVDPANRFFSGFASTADGFAGQSIGGALLPRLAAAHPAFFAVLIAGVTAYLAVAFLLGITVRLACGLGIAFAAVLLITQFGGTFAIPGGTDVGPMPLYLGIYGALLWGRADRLAPLWRLFDRRLARPDRGRPDERSLATTGLEGSHAGGHGGEAGGRAGRARAPTSGPTSARTGTP